MGFAQPILLVCVATNVNDGREYFVSLFDIKCICEACSAAVPEFIAIAYFDLTKDERSFSNSCTLLAA